MAARDVGGTDNMEKITIRLEADNKSICVESLQAGGGARIIRWAETNNDKINNGLWRKVFIEMTKL